jgi:putative transposase
MRKSKFTDEQVVAILRRGDRDPMAVVAQRHGVSEQTICCWCPALGAPAQPVRRDMAP